MRTITGNDTSLICNGKGETITIALDGKPITLRTPEKIVTVFSDTRWYGSDHLSFCRHLDGLQALIDYIPSADPSVPQRFYVHREIPVTPSSR